MIRTAKPTPKERAAHNVMRLLTRTDARAVRRCKYWLRQYGVRHFTSYQLRRPQAPFDLVCLATGVDPRKWDEPQTFDLGDGILVKDTREHLVEIGVLEY